MSLLQTQELEEKLTELYFDHISYGNLMTNGETIVEKLQPIGKPTIIEYESHDERPNELIKHKPKEANAVLTGVPHTYTKAIDLSSGCVNPIRITAIAVQYYKI